MEISQDFSLVLENGWSDKFEIALMNLIRIMLKSNIVVDVWVIAILE